MSFNDCCNSKNYNVKCFFEKSWKPFCDSKDGDLLEGVLAEGKGSDKWDYIVTPDKAYLSIHAAVWPQKGEEEGRRWTASEKIMRK